MTPALFALSTAEFKDVLEPLVATVVSVGTVLVVVTVASLAAVLTLGDDAEDDAMVVTTTGLSLLVVSAWTTAVADVPEYCEAAVSLTLTAALFALSTAEFKDVLEPLVATVVSVGTVLVVVTVASLAAVLTLGDDAEDDAMVVTTTGLSLLVVSAWTTAVADVPEYCEAAVSLTLTAALFALSTAEFKDVLEPLVATVVSVGTVLVVVTVASLAAVLTLGDDAEDDAMVVTTTGLSLLGVSAWTTAPLNKTKDVPSNTEANPKLDFRSPHLC